MIESVMESIRDGVTEHDLIACSRKIREEWKKREAHEKAEAARKAMNGHAPAGGQREVSMKRKLENGDEEAESVKRHHSAQHQEGGQQ